MKRNLFFLFLALVGLVSCDRQHEPERVAGNFLLGYLDCRFTEVAGLASPEVCDQMRWRASQVTQTDLDLLNERGEGAEVTDVETTEEDNEAEVLLTVRHALLLDSIGQPARIGQRRYCVGLQKKQGGNWIVTALREVP